MVGAVSAVSSEDSAMILTSRTKLILRVAFAAWALAWGAVFLVFVLPKMWPMLMDWIRLRVFTL